jgi:hypothetical protein
MNLRTANITVIPQLVQMRLAYLTEDQGELLPGMEID